MLDVLDFWLDMGVDGMRLDAVPYLYEREGTNCENLPETHAFLKNFARTSTRSTATACCWRKPTSGRKMRSRTSATGDECHMAFHFPAHAAAVHGAPHGGPLTRSSISCEQTPPIPENCQWAMFLRNHDELTLEMVTDEERDYMYRVYAHDRQTRINLGIRRRLAPLLGNDRRRIELMNALLFSLPGTPVLYYGDEIGMGDNIYLGDRNGVRTPMQWSADRNAGFSRANPQRCICRSSSIPNITTKRVNVEAQQNNPNSLLWWMKRLIRHRKRFKAFGRGTIEFLHPENRRCLRFRRGDTRTRTSWWWRISRGTPSTQNWIVARFLGGWVPVEVIRRRASSRRSADGPYQVTLSGHGFYWFTLESQKGQQRIHRATGSGPEDRRRSSIRSLNSIARR